VLSSTAPMDRSSFTISGLDPYTPSGLIINRSNVLKSTLVIDAYAPGDIALMNRWRESWVMTTLSTIVWLTQTNGSDSKDVTHHGRYSRIHRRRQGDDTCRLLFRPGLRVWSESPQVGDTETVRFADQSSRRC